MYIPTRIEKEYMSYSKFGFGFIGLEICLILIHVFVPSFFPWSYVITTFVK